VNDAFFVRGFERLRNLMHHAERLVRRDGPASDPFGKRLALDQLHREEIRALKFLEAVQRGDVGMVQRRQRLRFAFETRGAVAISREGFRQQLDRDAASEPRVARPVHLSHTAGAEAALNFVLAQGLADHFAVQLNTPRISGGGPESSASCPAGRIMTNCLPSGMMS
jgi:hypothetical protein